MQNAIRRVIGIWPLCATLAIAIAPGLALAQSGSAGGSIGNDEKSLSGSRQAPRAIEPERPARRTQERRSASRPSGGGGNFDGAWIVNSVGVTCSGSSTTAVIVSSGRVIGEGLTGTISPNGASRSIGNYGGITVTSTGHTSGRGGSGTFKRSDGCVGRWTSSKQ